MTPERWQQIDHLLEAVLNQPPELRDAFLDEACSGDDISREEIESLLSFRERAESFLETPALDAADFLFEPAEPLVGRMLGAYRIERELGSGGMGEVYLAHDTRLDRKLAIKVVPFELNEGERATRLIREAKAAARLDHPNICQIHEVAEEDGIGFIVMQYVDGETLASRLERGRPDLAETLDVMAEVADALSEAHTRGIVHRDIKPANIMITSRSQVKVLDFGLAKVVGAVEAVSGEAQPQSLWSAPGVIAGTAPYMSPEQATGSTIDARSDLFSLGVVLYQCLAGSLPFSGKSPIETCRKVAHYDPPAPSELNPDVPPEVDRIVMKALAKRAGERYQSASDLAKDMRSVAAAWSREMPVAGVGVSTVELRRKMVWKPFALAAAVLLALVVILLVGLPRWRTPPLHVPAPEAQRTYEEGMEALRAGNYYTASEEFEQAVQLDDEFAMAHARLAESLAELDYIDKANREWTKVTALVPDWASLPPVDRLYLEAINQTLVPNFERAVESYRQMVQIAPEADKAHAYFDLGRAYEKANKLEQALESYKKAVEFVPTNAAALLRTGILHGSRNDGKADIAEAFELFDSAEKLYGDQDNEEGLIEVLYHRGLLHKRTNRLQEAYEELERALTRAERLSNTYQQVRIQLAFAGVLEKMKRFMEAREFATTAQTAAETTGMQDLPTEALIEIGDLLRALGNYAMAHEYLQRARQYAHDRRGRSEAKALLLLGRLYLDQHNMENARPCLERALEMYRQQADTAGQSQALFLDTVLKEPTLDYVEAQKRYEENLALAQQSGDISLTAQLEEAIGFVFAHREAFSDALERFKTARDLFGASRSDYAATNNLLNVADMLWRMGRYEDARDGLEAAGVLNDPKLRAKKARVQLQMWLSERKVRRAVRHGRVAAFLNSQTGHLGEVKAVLGIALTLSGRMRDGVRECEAAVNAVEKQGGWMLWGAKLALAEALLATGDTQRALKTALEMQAVFGRVGQRESEWRASLVAAEASFQLSDQGAALAHAFRALSLLQTLREELGDGYASRPDIRHSIRRLDLLLAAER